MIDAPTVVSKIAGVALFIGITLYDVFTNDYFLLKNYK
jgi:hypothetical protein